jgi:alpha-1,6-mannosyltransferase
MEARVRGRGDVRFMGFEKDRMKLVTALASADVLLHGCPYETFGFAVAEAMSVGLPVVVPDGGGAGELAHGACSERYSPGDVDGCVAAITRLLAREPESLRRGALRAAEAFPSIYEQFAKTYEAYAELLRSPTRMGKRQYGASEEQPRA